MEVNALNVLILDDHPVFRHGLYEIMNEMPFVRKTEQAGNVDEALELISKQPIDIVLLDLGLPGKSGLDFMKELNVKVLEQKPRVIVISSHSEASKVHAAYTLGVFGYIMKDTPVKEIRQAMITVAGGEPYFSENIRKVMLDNLVKQRTEPQDEVTLTPMELQVMQLVCQKLKNKEIADKLFRSEATIKRHRNKINEKIGVSNSAGVIMYAIEKGLFQVGQS